MSIALRRAVIVVVACLAPSAPLAAQTEYYNLDAGRPTRIEDAIPTERYALELVLGGLRVDWLARGAQRWRTEPKVVYGVLPFTEIEVRVPVIRAVSRNTSAPAATGVGGVAIGALHAFNLETNRLPAFALESEVQLPAGLFGAPATSYSLKALVTRTTHAARFHFNGSVGTYSVQPAAVADTSCPLSTLAGCANGKPIPVPFDFPCASAAIGPGQSRSVTTAAATGTANPSRSHGTRWLVGVGADRAWPLQSLLLGGNIFAERFAGLYALTDWTAEVGARTQWTPRLVFDLGAARHFAGTVQSSAATIGVTYTLSTRQFSSMRVP